MGAPLLTEWMSALYGWRSAFMVSGILGSCGFRSGSRSPDVRPLTGPASCAGGRVHEILRDRRYLALVIANILAMTIYSLWTNWTTVFLVSSYGLTRQEANLQYAWIPPIFATLGGLVGAWLANRAIRGGTGSVPRRACDISIAAAVFAFATAFAPIAPAPWLAT